MPSNTMFPPKEKISYATLLNWFSAKKEISNTNFLNKKIYYTCLKKTNFPLEKNFL